MDGKKLEIKNEVYDYIVDKALEYKLGARGLRSIFEQIMADIMFDAPSMEGDVCEVSLDYAKSKVEKVI
jgi:ATP-dependent Clp protease ATP-binding subunit ClpX